MQWKHRGEDSELICMGHPIKLIDVKQILFLPILLAESMLQVLLLLYIFFIKRLKIGPISKYLGDVSRVYYLLGKKR